MRISWENGVHEGPVNWSTSDWRRIAPSAGLSQEEAIKVLENKIPAVFRTYIALDAPLESHWVSGISERSLARDPASIILSFTIRPKLMDDVVGCEKRQDKPAKAMMRRYRHYHLKIGGPKPKPQVSLQPPVYKFGASSTAIPEEPKVTPYGRMETVVKNGLGPKSLIERSMESVKIYKGIADTGGDRKIIATEPPVAADSPSLSPDNTQAEAEESHKGGKMNEVDEKSSEYLLAASANDEGNAAQEADVVTQVSDEEPNDDPKKEVVPQDAIS
jgi:hypothetical protein